MTYATKLKKCGFAILVMAAIASVSVSSAAESMAQVVGPIYTGPSAFTGGNLSYQFTLQAAKPGTVVVKSTVAVSGGKWTPKPTIPQVTASAVVGPNKIKSEAIAIPSTFLGNATISFSITFTSNDAKPVKQTVSVKPVKVPIVPQVAFYDVGFGTPVLLNAAGISTKGMGSKVEYKWVQKPNSLGTMTPGGILSSNSTVAPTLTTGLKALTDLVGATTPNLVALDNEEVTKSTYVYEVTVSGNKVTRNGTFTVACAAQTTSTDLPLGVNALYMGGNGTTWSLENKPVGSNATLSTSTDGVNAVARLMPDIAGNYTVTGNSTGGNLTAITNKAAAYHVLTTCSGCHGPSGVGTDIVTTWQKTGHATMAKRGINGEVSPYYNESCFQCHTLGYNNSVTSADNGNFKAVANRLGWQFPAELKVTNWDAMPAQLQNLANIQCESCHGPILNPGSTGHGNGTVSLDVQVCASCHQDGHYHNRVAQWDNGPHSNPFKVVSETEGTNAGCVRCHSPNGFQDVASRIDKTIAQGNGTVAEAAAAQILWGNNSTLTKGIGPLTCQTCHDPHDGFDNPDRHQVRIWDTVVIGDLAAAGNVTLSNQTDATIGNSAACEICHNSRRLPMQLSNGAPRYKGIRSGFISGPHESPVAEVFNGVYTSAINYDYQMGNSYHTYVADCQSCHMYKLRDVDSKGVPQDYVTINGTFTPVTASLYQEVRDLVGDHSFNMANDYVTANGTSEIQDVASCNQCHDGAVKTLDFKGVTARDYDGNGVTSGIQTETQGLLDEIKVLFESQGVTFTQDPATGYWNINSAGLSTDPTIKDAQLKAAWNWLLIYRDHSLGVHNTQFTIRLLQTTWTNLSVANGGQTFHVAYPLAFLR